MIDKIFKNSKVNMDKLEKYGFAKRGGAHEFRKNLLDGQFNLIVNIDAQGQVQTKVYDVESGEEYVLHLMPDAVGEFVGNVRTAVEKELLSIRENCFEKHVFKSCQAQEIIRFVKDKYGDQLEFLWEKFPNNAILRRKDTNKWYVAILTVSKRKLGLDCDEVVEIIDLRIKPEEIQNVVDGKKFFLGYHMNKKHWFTICLDGSVATEEIFKWVDKSYLLAK